MDVSSPVEAGGGEPMAEAMAETGAARDAAAPRGLGSMLSLLPMLVSVHVLLSAMREAIDLTHDAVSTFHDGLIWAFVSLGRYIGGAFQAWEMCGACLNFVCVCVCMCVRYGKVLATLDLFLELGSM